MGGKGSAGVGAKTETKGKARRKKVAAIRQQLNGLHLPANADSSYWRATSLIPEIIDEFLSAAQLVWDGDPSPYGETTPYELREPELVYLEFLWSPGSLARRRVRRGDRRNLDLFQETLLLEFQSALLTVIGSLQESPDRIVEYASHGLIDQAVAGATASITSNSEPIAVVFHQRLLFAARKLLLSTYEGEHATVGIIVVPESAAEALRWTNLVQDGIAFLLQTKIARALSDADESAFVFSGTGEFLGLFDRKRVRQAIGRARGVVEWQIKHALTLGLKVDKQRRMELVSGNWRFVDDLAARTALAQSDESFSTCNRILWDLALRQSEARHGALILVVGTPAKLVKARGCKAEELNLPGSEARIDAKMQELGVSSDDGLTWGPGLLPKEILLEQFRGKRVTQIRIDVLARLVTVDGALIVGTDGEFYGFGVILSVEGDPSLAPTEGARTRAALLASKFGVAIKVSEDGPITIYKNRKQVFP